MASFNSQLQEYLERALRTVATETLLSRGGVETVAASGTKATLGLLRGDLEQLKQLQQEAHKDTKQLQEETKEELVVLAADVQAVQQRMGAIEEKLEAVLSALLEGGAAGAGAAGGGALR